MKNIILSICSTFLLLSTSNVHASDKRTQIADTLTNLVNNRHLSDSVKAIQISELALMDYLLDINITKSTEYMQTAMNFANKWSNDDPKMFVYSVKMQMGRNAEETNNAVDSCAYYTSRSENPLVRSLGWQNLAKAKVHTPEALEYLLKALDEVKGKGYWLQEQSVYYDITHYYHISVNDYPQLPVYSQLSLEAALKSDDNYIIAKSWHDVGVAYYMNYTIDPENMELKDKSYDAFIRTYTMYEEGIIDNTIREYQLLYVTTLINLSNIAYIGEDMALAIKYMNEALTISLQYNESSDIDYSMKPYIYHNSKMYILQAYSTLSRIHKEKGNYAAAEQSLLKALAFLPENIVDDVRNGRYPAHRLNLDLADLYYTMGKYSEAVKYYDIGFKEYKNNYDFQLQAMNDHLASAYETERKEKQLDALNQSLSLRKTQNYLLATLIVVLVVILVLLFYYQKYRLLTAKQREYNKENETKILRLSKDQIELEAQLKELETEKYQKELLAGSLLIDHKNKVLEDLRTFLINNPILSEHREELEKIFTDDADTLDESDNFKTDLQDIHPVFYTRLQEQANDKLTPLDLKYCHMIFMKMSSKEIADILHVDPKTVRVNKYRLKQKLRLEKSEDLNSFVERMARPV